MNFTVRSFLLVLLLVAMIQVASVAKGDAAKSMHVRGRKNFDRQQKQQDALKNQQEHVTRRGLHGSGEHTHIVLDTNAVNYGKSYGVQVDEIVDLPSSSMPSDLPSSAIPSN